MESQLTFRGLKWHINPKKKLTVVQSYVVSSFFFFFFFFLWKSKNSAEFESYLASVDTNEFQFHCLHCSMILNFAFLFFNSEKKRKEINIYLLDKFPQFSLTLIMDWISGVPCHQFGSIMGCVAERDWI